MRPQREAQMACGLEEIEAFTEALGRLRASCETAMREYHLLNVETQWQTGDGEGQEATKEMERMQLKLVMDVSFRDDKPIFPPVNTRLSDSLVYLAVKFLAAKGRGKSYPYDFTSNGDIRTQRVPSGPPPIIWAHGLPFFPVYRGYYILCGREHALWIGWKLRNKEWNNLKNHPTWSIGSVIAPSSAVALRRSINRQQRVHSPQKGNAAPGSESNDPSPDYMSAKHDQCTVFPKAPNGHAAIVPLWLVKGYDVRCGPNIMDGRLTVFMPREFFARFEDFDYDAALKKPYVNEWNPTVDMTVDDEEEADGKGEEEEQQNPRQHGPIYCPSKGPAKHEREDAMDTVNPRQKKVRVQQGEIKKEAQDEYTIPKPAAAEPRVTSSTPLTRDPRVRGTPKKNIDPKMAEYRRYIRLGQKLTTRFPRIMEVWNEIERAGNLKSARKQLQEDMLVAVDDNRAELKLLELCSAEDQIEYFRISVPGHIEAIGDGTAAAVLGDMYTKTFGGTTECTEEVDTSSNNVCTTHATTVRANQPAKKQEGEGSIGNTNTVLNPNTATTASASHFIKKEDFNGDTCVGDLVVEGCNDNDNDNASSKVIVKDNADANAKTEAEGNVKAEGNVNANGNANVEEMEADNVPASDTKMAE